MLNIKNECILLPELIPTIHGRCESMEGTFVRGFLRPISIVVIVWAWVKEIAIPTGDDDWFDPIVGSWTREIIVVVIGIKIRRIESTRLTIWTLRESQGLC